jgi:hypothetical protein
MLIPRNLLWCSMVILGFSPQLAAGLAGIPVKVPGLN